MSSARFQAVPDGITPEEARERATALLDANLDLLCDLLGPIAMQALVAGRVLRAQLKFQGKPSA